MVDSTYPYKNLVFEGGGVKGLAYLGALEVLDSKGITPQIQRVAGASAGAITACLVSLGYTSAEIREIMLNLDFTKFEDGGLEGPVRIVEQYGWFKGDFFLNFIEDKIAAKTGNSRATFADLKAPQYKQLYVVGTDLTTQLSVVFSADQSADMPVADAVRISMSIPLFFAARKLNDNIYCDGGVLNNYPLTLFDVPDDTTNWETLGFHLDNLGQPPIHKINDLPGFIGNVYEAIINIQVDLLMSEPDDVKRSVFIDNLGIKTTDFHLTQAQKLALVESGRSATLKYLSK